MTDESEKIADLEQKLGLSKLPDAIKTHDHFVLWRYEEREKSDDSTYETKVPLKPFPSNHPYAKPNDPETWGTYEQALELLARPGVDAEGIGFVFTNDDMVMGIDLDSVHDPDTEHTEPAATKILNLLDSYTEYSPSDTGYHALVLGTMPDSDYNKQPFDRADPEQGGLGDVFDEHPDIEVYETGRFFTMSGKHVEGTPETINERNDELQTIADEYLQKAPDDNTALDDFATPTVDIDTYDPEDDPAVGAVVSLDDDQIVEKAMQAKNGDKFRDLYRGHWQRHYSSQSQSEADLAFCGMLAFWTQRDVRQMDSIFRDSGLMRPKWDEDRGDQTYGEMTLREAASGVRDVYDPMRRNDYTGGKHDDDVDTDPESEATREELQDQFDEMADRPDADADAHAQEDTGDDTDTAADGGDTAADVTLTSDSDPDPDPNPDPDPGPGTPSGGGNGGGGGGGGPARDDDDEDDELPGTVVLPSAGSPLVRRPEHSGDRGYSVRVGDPADPEFEPITNFLLSVEHILLLPDGSEAVELHVLPAHGDAYTVQVEPAVFNEPHEFRAAVCTGRATWFEGSRTNLNHLRELLGVINAPVLRGVEHIGMYGTDTGTPELVLPDGTLRADGWADPPDHVYVERNVEAERKVTLVPDRKPDAGFDVDTVCEVLDTLPQTRDPERFIPVLGWFYAAAFRPYIKSKVGEFNHLTVTGDTGSGKSTTLTTVSECFGMGGDPFGLRGTKFELTANISVPNALPLLYDEYKPSELESYILDHFHDHIRKSSRGAVEQRGQQDGSTKSYPLNAPLVVAGESAIQGPAERRRSIMTTFRETTTDAGTPTAEAFDRLRDIDGAQDHAFAWYWWTLGQLRDTTGLDARWEAAERRVRAILADRGFDYKLLDPLPFRGLQTVVFGAGLFRAFGDSMSLDADAVGRERMNDAAVAEAIGWLAEELLDGEQRKSHMEEFLELMSEAASMDYLERDTHYTFVSAGTPSEELRFHFKRCYAAVRKYIRDYDIGGDVDILGSGDYFKRFADAEENTAPGSFITCVSQYSPPINRAIGVHILDADDAMSGFEPSSFGATATHPPAPGDHTDDDPDPDASDTPGDTEDSDDSDDSGNDGVTPDDDDDGGGGDGGGQAPVPDPERERESIAYDEVPPDAEGPAADRRRAHVALVELYARETEPVGFGVLAARCAEKHDFSPETTKELVRSMLEHGEAMDAGGDKLRPV